MKNFTSWVNSQLTEQKNVFKICIRQWIDIKSIQRTTQLSDIKETILEMGKHLNKFKHFSRKYIYTQMANKIKKWSSTSQIRKIQIKRTMRYHFSPLSDSLCQKKVNISVSKDVKKIDMCNDVGNAKWYNHYRKWYHNFFKNNKHRTAIGLNNCISEYTSKINESRI